MARPIVSNLMVNPFAPAPKAVQTPMVSTGNIYDPLVSRAMAAVNCGLEYIGFDIDADYRQFAQDRIADSAKEQLFTFED